MKHLLKLKDLDQHEILDILNLADQLKYETKHGIEHHHLKGKTLGMIFQKSSTRTRVSFETGMYQLGGQALADLMTIREYKKSFDGLKFCFIGDGNNMANSLIVGAITMGMSCAIACPDEYKPDAEIMKWAEENGNFICSSNILECAKDADILYTDVWASMGQEEEKAEREKVFKDYQINDKVMGVAKDDAMVLHCLPAHREEEITAKVFEEHANEIFDEAENRLHAQKAVLVKLLG